MQKLLYSDSLINRNRNRKMIGAIATLVAFTIAPLLAEAGFCPSGRHQNREYSSDVSLDKEVLRIFLIGFLCNSEAYRIFYNDLNNIEMELPTHEDAEQAAETMPEQSS